MNDFLAGAGNAGNSVANLFLGVVIAAIVVVAAGVGGLGVGGLVWWVMR